jgi:hypothetical protein
MVSHVVLMKPRPDLSADDRAAMVSAFERTIAEIGSVRAVRIGKRVVHGAAYEASSPDTIDYIAMIDFDDVADLQEYLRHPAHDELGVRVGQALSLGIVYDFEMLTLDALRVGGLFEAE